MILKDVGEINATVLRSDNLASVTKLRIQDAGVTGIAEGAFSSFQNLTDLHLNRNLLTEMNPNWLGRPDNLAKLSLTENHIEVLNETMLDGLVHLKSLSLNKNRIRTIDPNSFNSQTVLDELDLSENRMTWVSPQVFRSLRSTRIRLDGNPWDCSCGAEDFVDFIREAYMTSQPSVMEISVRPYPTDLPINISTPTGVTEILLATPRPSDTNIVCTLVVVIVVLSLLLFVGGFLVVLHRRKHKNKTVTPGCPKQNRDDLKGGGSRSSPAPSPGQNRDNHHWDSEEGWRTSFTGVRAKSANAILFTSPFSAPMKDQVTSQNETEAEGKQKVESETEGDGGFETEKATDSTENTKQAADGRNLDKDPYSVVSTDTVPYLSIGTSQKSPDDFIKQSTDGSGQRSQTRRVMGRISTWPPTAIQWQARCKMMKEKEEERSDVFTVWTPKFPSEAKKASDKVEHPPGSVLDQKDTKT
ncbi:Reticulon-4 receptor-like 1, partial [Nibea albiflora]